MEIDDEVHLVSDGDGLAVIGSARAVEQFLAEEELANPQPMRWSEVTGRLARQGSQAADAVTTYAQESGQWLKITAESADKIKKYGLMRDKRTGLQLATLQSKGLIKGPLQIVKVGTLASPAGLALAGAMLAQHAQEQQMAEIQEYLETIDRKIDKVLRNQDDDIIAPMLGVELTIDSVMAVRRETGRVSATTWSTIQDAPGRIATTQARALLKLREVAEEIRAEQSLGEAAQTARKLSPTIQKWLAVLAHCLRLQEALAVIELDRVLDAEPAELEAHTSGLRVARAERHANIERALGSIMAALDDVASKANGDVIFNPFNAPAVVRERNDIASHINDFGSHTGVTTDVDAVEPRAWWDAVDETREDAVEWGAGVVHTTREAAEEQVKKAASLGRKGAVGAGSVAQEAFKFLTERVPWARHDPQNASEPQRTNPDHEGTTTT